MADFYCDHGAYGLGTNRLGVDAPAWGVPQEGDGSSPSPAASASTAFVSFSAAPTSGAVSVMGVTVSVTGVNGAASAGAAANQLASNINSTTTTTSFGGLTIQLRNLVYARGPSSGAPAGTCQVMARIGSSRLNYSANVACLIAHTFNNASETADDRQFSGGQGGCWGWFINPSALGAASSIAAVTYGAWLHLPVVASPAVPTASDIIWCRTGGGASKLIDFSTGGTANLAHSASYSKTIVFDTNQKWPSDSAVGVLKFRFTCTGWNVTSSIRLSAPSGGRSSYTAQRRGGFEIEYVCNQTQGQLTFIAAHTGGCAYHLKNVSLIDSAVGGASFQPGAQSGSSGTLPFSVQWEDTDFKVTTPRSALAGAFFSLGWFATISDQRYVGCTFDFNISGVSDPGGLISTTNTYTDSSLALVGCEFKGFSGGYRPFTGINSGWISTGASLAVTIDGCSGLAMPSTYLGLPSTTEFRSQNIHTVMYSTVGTGNPGMRVEDNRGVCEWVPNDPTPFPTCASILAGDGTPYSLRVIWVPAVPLSAARPYTSVPMRMLNQLASGARTLTLRVFVPSDITQNLKARFTYVDDAGVARSVETGSLDSDTTAWNNSGLYIGHVARKFTAVTEYSVKAASEMVASLCFFGPPPGSSPVAVYVDPEFEVV